MSQIRTRHPQLPAAGRLKLKRPVLPGIQPTIQPIKLVEKDIQPNVSRKILPFQFDELELEKISQMAHGYRAAPYSYGQIAYKNEEQIKSVSLDIGSKIGFGLGAYSRENESIVVGRGKRIRARVTLASFGNIQVLERNKVIPGILSCFSNVDKIDVSTRVKRFNTQETFRDWYAFQVGRKTIANNVELLDPESDFLKKLGAEMAKLNNDRDGYAPVFSRKLSRAWKQYLAETYPLAFRGYSDLSAYNMYTTAWLSDVASKYKLASFQNQGLLQCHQVMNSYPKVETAPWKLKKRLQFVYDYFCKAQMLRYPFAFAMQIEPNLRQEIVDHFRAYVQSGGFLYIDDQAEVGTSERHYREFIARTLKQIPDNEREAGLAGVLRILQRHDRSMNGYNIEKNLPDIYHPYTRFSFSVPEKRDVIFRFFDESASLVRTLKLKQVLPGFYISPSGQTRVPLWDGLDENGDPVENGTYFAQMESGLFRKTMAIHVSGLRLLDPKRHQVFQSYYTFDATPKCKTSMPVQRAFGPTTWAY